MNTLGERLKHARKVRNMTQDELSAASGIKQGSISKIERGDQEKTTFGHELATALKVNREWLESGAGAMERFGIEEASTPYTHTNVTGPRAVVLTMPLISWVKAGDWCDSPDEFQPGDAEAWIPRPETGSGDRAFALRVDGDSMVAPYPGARSYPHGTIIYVDPDKLLTNGARVVARANGDYTFKCYVEDAGKKYLKALNPQYPIIDITEDVHICGVVFGSFNAE